MCCRFECIRLWSVAQGFVVIPWLQNRPPNKLSRSWTRTEDTLTFLSSYTDHYKQECNKHIFAHTSPRKRHMYWTPMYWMLVSRWLMWRCVSGLCLDWTLVPLFCVLHVLWLLEHPDLPWGSKKIPSLPSFIPLPNHPRARQSTHGATSNYLLINPPIWSSVLWPIYTSNHTNQPCAHPSVRPSIHGIGIFKKERALVFNCACVLLNGQ